MVAGGRDDPAELVTGTAFGALGPLLPAGQGASGAARGVFSGIGAGTAQNVINSPPELGAGTSGSSGDSIEALVIAATMLVLFVVMSQSAVSLLGREVPVKWLDRLAVQPLNRIGLIRPLGVLVSAVIAFATQAVIVLSIAEPGLGDIPRAILVVELVGATTWAAGLLVVAVGNASRQSGAP